MTRTHRPQSTAQSLPEAILFGLAAHGDQRSATEVLAELALSDRLTVEVEHDDGTQERLSVPTSELRGAFRQLE